MHEIPINWKGHGIRDLAPPPEESRWKRNSLIYLGTTELAYKRRLPDRVIKWGEIRGY